MKNDTELQLVDAGEFNLFSSVTFEIGGGNAGNQICLQCGMEYFEKVSMCNSKVANKDKIRARKYSEFPFLSDEKAVIEIKNCIKNTDPTNPHGAANELKKYLKRFSKHIFLEELEKYCDMILDSIDNIYQDDFNFLNKEMDEYFRIELDDMIDNIFRCVLREEYKDKESSLYDICYGVDFKQSMNRPGCVIDKYDESWLNL
jgi:hypothetical protein